MTKALRFSFGEREVLRGIDLSVCPGEVVALVGPNGSGKTTLLRSLAGLTDFQGEVRYGDESLSAMSLRERAQKRAYVPQRLPATFPYTIEEMVAMGAAHRDRFYALRSKSECVQEVLNELEFSPASHRSFTKLSGGERQQVLIARALLQGGPIFLLDEPTSALDLQHRASVIRALRRKAQNGASVIFSMHDLNLAATAADRLILLYEGEVVADGKPEEVLERALIQKVYATQILAARHPLSGAPMVHLDPEAWSL